MRFLQLYNYEIAIFLAMVGLYIVVSRGNLVKKIAGLSMGGFVGQKIVVQIVPAQQQRLYPHTRVEQHARCRKYLEDARRHRLHGVVEAKYQRVEDDAGREDDARLKSASRAVIAMELDVKGKQQNDWHEQLGYDPEDGVMQHQSISSSSSRRRDRRIPNKAITAMPAVNITVVSPRVS